MKNTAFTLSEVLITLGIIGVIAALTIPRLITNYKAKRLRTQFLKSYSVIQQVFKQMEADDVSLDPATYKVGTFYKTFANYLQGAFDCGGVLGSRKLYLPCYSYQNDGGGEYSEPYKSLDGKSKVSGSYFDDGQLALQNGSLLLFENQGRTGIIWVSVDLNGYNNPPNRYGYDLFTFELDDGELKTMGDRATKYNDTSKYCNFKGSGSLNGIACAQKAKENSDYFKTLVMMVK